LRIKFLFKNVTIIVTVKKLFSIMDDKNYSWKGSPNAGLVLTILALLGAVAVFTVGFAG
jgi:hypothetical protein